MSNAKCCRTNARGLSLVNLSLKRQVVLIFAVSSVLPVLIAFYLNYDRVLGGSRRISAFLFLAAVLSLLSLFLLVDIAKSLSKEE